jgi:hypothetical protein
VAEVAGFAYDRDHDEVAIARQAVAAAAIQGPSSC